MISSCNKCEGASTIAVNLSGIFAQESTGETLVIDANLRNSSLEKVYGVKKAPGLTDIVVEEVDIVAAISTTKIKNLKVLTAGNPVSNPTSVLNSEKLSNLLDNLKKSFKYIIIDSAPIMPFSDSVYLSSKVDIILLVIEAERTRWEIIQEAIQKLSLDENKVLGTVLNKKKSHIPSVIYKRL